MLYILTHKLTLTIIISSSINIFLIISSSLLTSSHLLLHCAVHSRSQTHPHHNHFIINQYLPHHFHLTQDSQYLSCYFTVLFILTHKLTLTIIVSSSISIFLIISTSLLTSSHLFLHCASHPHSQTHPHHNHFIINQYLHHHFHLTPHIISPVSSLCSSSSLTNSPSP